MFNYLFNQMRDLISGGLSGLLRGFFVWLVAFLLMFIPFKLFHPIEPFFFFALVMILILIYFTNKWYSSIGSAKKATEEAIASGQQFVDADEYDEEKESPLKRFKNKFYHHLLMALMAGSMMACSYKICYDTSPQGRVVEALESTAVKSWNANNIDMVHLKDSLHYVTDADSILDPATVNEMNECLRKMDTDLDVKSAVIICRQVDGSDTYRTAVDLINKYQIGSKTSGWGLCVVIAYDQHQWTIGTSREMESVLTDLECSRLGETYIVPMMAKNMPDSALLYLVNNTYSYLKNKKEAGKAEIEPLFSAKKSLMTSETGTYTLLIMLLCALYGILNRKYRWTKSKRPNMAAVIAAPSSDDDVSVDDQEEKEEKEDTPDRGGSYGGGSSGGGGATGKW